MLVCATAPTRAADCTATIGRRLDRFITQVDAWQRRCARRSDVAGCRAQAQLRTVEAATRASRAVGRACTSARLFDPAPAGLAFPRRCAELAAGRPSTTCDALPITDGRMLADCLLCWQRTDLEHLAAWVLPCAGDRATCAACGPSDDREQRCQRAIAVAAFDEQTRKTRALSACLRDVDAGRRTGPCPDLRVELESATALTHARRTLSACDAPPRAWAACAATADAGPCAAISTVGGVTACLDAATTRLSTAGACRREPGAGAHDLACAASSAH